MKTVLTLALCLFATLTFAQDKISAYQVKTYKAQYDVWTGFETCNENIDVTNDGGGLYTFSVAKPGKSAWIKGTVKYDNADGGFYSYKAQSQNGGLVSIGTQAKLSLIATGDKSILGTQIQVTSKRGDIYVYKIKRRN
jgi:hypothetical protein